MHFKIIIIYIPIFAKLPRIFPAQRLIYNPEPYRFLSERRENEVVSGPLDRHSRQTTDCHEIIRIIIFECLSIILLLSTEICLLTAGRGILSVFFFFYHLMNFSLTPQNNTLPDDYEKRIHRRTSLDRQLIFQHSSPSSYSSKFSLSIALSLHKTH